MFDRFKTGKLFDLLRLFFKFGIFKIIFISESYIHLIVVKILKR